MAIRQRKKAHFKVLFSNDNTQILSTVSPYHKKGELFRPEMLEASVDETANTDIDVHMLQTAGMWVPWWQSKIVPPKEHYKWAKKTLNVELDSYAEYLINGGDMIECFVNRCHKKKLLPFVSYRLNDAHHKGMIYGAAEGKTPSYAAHAISKFDYDHPEYRLGLKAAHPEFHIFAGPNYFQGVQNWAIEAVRDYKYAFIEEICKNYDIAGLELDFLRFFSFFSPEETSSEQRTDIMTSFVQKVRKLLDDTGGKASYRWLSVRIPAYIDAFDLLGIDVDKFVRAGVDMFNLSTHFFTDQQSDYPAIRKMIPDDRAVYLEVTQTTATGAWNGLQRLTTPVQFYTTAHLAYKAGLDGISTFNLHYYRDNANFKKKTPPYEVPYDVLKKIGDDDWVAQQPQHYFFTNTFLQPPLGNYRQIPKIFEQGTTNSFSLLASPPKGGWKEEGILRLQSSLPFGKTQWQVKINGTKLSESQNVSEPYGKVYDSMLGNEKTLKAWRVPENLMINGTNKIDVTELSGHMIEIIFLDLAIS